MSAYGTSATSRNVRFCAAFGGKADIDERLPNFRRVRIDRLAIGTDHHPLPPNHIDRWKRSLGFARTIGNPVIGFARFDRLTWRGAVCIAFDRVDLLLRQPARPIVSICCLAFAELK